MLDGLLARHRKGWTLERGFYTEPALFERELERVFRTSWLYAGHESRIPRPGDFFTWEVAGTPLLVARDAQGEVHAFLDVCRHRGTRVSGQPCGNADRFICPYHGWTYGLDGRLLAARLMPKDFPKADFGLRRAAVRVAEGLIFVCLAERPPDLAPALSAIRGHLEPYELGKARICLTREYDVRANWKIVVENARECYHCVVAHPELSRLMPHVAIDSPGQMEQFEREFAAQSAVWEEMGLSADNVPMGEREYHVMRFAFRKGVVTQTMDGRPKAPLLGRLERPEAGVVACSILPGFWLEASCDYAFIWRLNPTALDRTHVRVDWLVRGDAREGVDFKPEEVAEFWRVTLEQDWELCRRNQEGVTAVGYVPGPFAPGLDRRATLGEAGPQSFVEWYLGRIGKDRCEGENALPRPD